MSGADQTSARPARIRGRLATALDHDLLGWDDHDARLPLFATAALVVATGLGLLLEQVVVAVGHDWTLAVAIEALRFATILAAPVLVASSVPYALWNGGPLGATLLATAPTVAAGVTRLQVVLSADVVLGLLAAGVAATLAAATNGHRRAGADDATLCLHADDLLVASTVAVVATVAFVRLAAAPSPPTATWIDPLGAVLVLPAAGLAVAWWTWLHADRQ